MARNGDGNFLGENLYSEQKNSAKHTEEKAEADRVCVSDETKAAEIGSKDTKTGKRNNANKKSASSSKERRKRYMAALERAVQNLRTSSTSLSAQLNSIEEDTNGLSLKNKDLKMSMQSMENEVHLQDARNEKLKKEMRELRGMVRQSIQNNAPTMSFTSGQQFQPHKKEYADFDMRAALPSPSYTDDSSDNSSSNDPITVLFNDYRLF